MSDPLHPPEAQVSTPIVSRYTDGGHELDSTPNRKLMLQIMALAVVIVASGFFVMQLVQQEGRTLLAEQQARVSSLLLDHRASVKETLTTYDRIEPGEGVARPAYRIPVDKARELVLSRPDLLRAGPPPAGFVHPDDLPTQGGEAPAAPAPEAPAPEAPAPEAPAAPAPEAPGEE